MPSFGIAERCAKVVQAYKIESERPLTNWNTTIGPWDRLSNKASASSVSARGSWS